MFPYGKILFCLGISGFGHLEVSLLLTKFLDGAKLISFAGAIQPPREGRGGLRVVPQISPGTKSEQKTNIT